MIPGSDIVTNTGEDHLLKPGKEVDGMPNSRVLNMRRAISDAVTGFLLGVAFMLILIQVWGLGWVRVIAPGWSPGL